MTSPKEGDNSLKNPGSNRPADGDPKALPLVDYNLIGVPAESEKRQMLLRAVTVDERGVARCINPDSGVETMLVAVRVDDARVATRVPFKVAENGGIAFELPADKPSRIGFFVGHKADQSVMAVLRMGLYPGVPLTTQNITDERMKEIMYGVKGIQATEVDEKRWAEEIGLFTELRFTSEHSRGMFNKSHRPNSATDAWQESPLVVVPDRMRDLVRHYAEGDVKKDEFQILSYGTRPALQYDSIILPSSGIGYSDGFDVRSLGGATRGGLGIGFGEARARQAKTTATQVDSLQGAFKVITVPVI